MAGTVEGEEIGIKTQKAAEPEEQAEVSKDQSCLPPRSPRTPTLHPRPFPSPTFVTVTSTPSSSPAVSFTDEETEDQRGNGSKPWF